MESINMLLLLLLSISAAALPDNQLQELKKVEGVNVEQPQCPSDVHAVLRDLSIKLAVLQTNMEAVQRQNQEQANKLKEVEKQSNQVEALKLQQEEQSSRLTEVEKQSGQVDALKTQQQDQAGELKSLKLWSNRTENQVDSLLKEQEVSKVAFSASLRTSGSGHTGPINAFTPLVFRNVISNIGNAYNPNTGDFIAPVRGAYHFEIYIAGLGNSHNFGATLVKNGQRVVVAYETEAKSWGQASNAVTLLLEKNDIVSVQLWHGARIYENDNRHNTFSGRLLFTV